RARHGPACDTQARPGSPFHIPACRSRSRARVGCLTASVMSPITCAAAALACVLSIAAPAIVDPIAWSATRRLRWTDFIGPPQLRTGASAMTAYELSYDG